MKQLLFLLLGMFWVPGAVASPYRVSAGGGIGVMKNLNDRMAEGVSTSTAQFSGITEGTWFDVVAGIHARLGMGLDMAIFPGKAFVGNLVFLPGVSRSFTLFSRAWEAGFGLGPARTLAPTEDAGSIWWSTIIKVDLRTSIAGLDTGVHVTLQQIWMERVTDPWFISAGVEVRYNLLGASPGAVIWPPEPGKPEVPSDDPDQDGVIGDADRCPTSAPGAQVDEQGCESVTDGMRLADGLFQEGTDELTTVGEREVRRLAELLKVNGSLAVVLEVSAPGVDLATLRFGRLRRKLQELGIQENRILSGAREGTVEEVVLNFRLLL